MSDFSYVDMFVDSAGWRGVIGWVVLADDIRGDCFNVPFEYSANSDALSVGNMDAHLFARYRDEFLVDAREAYMENISELRQMN